jgi:hypothetical protein
MNRGFAEIAGLARLLDVYGHLLDELIQLLVLCCE